MNREAEEFRISSDIKQANLEILQCRLDQAERLLKDISETLRSDRKVESANFIDSFLASQQGEATHAETARVHPEKAEGAQGERDTLESILDDVCEKGGDLPVDTPIYNISLNEIAEAFTRWQARAALAQPSPVQTCTHPDCGRFYDHNAKRWACRAWADNACAADQAQTSPKHEPRLVECDACPTSGGCVEVCMKAPAQPSPAPQKQEPDEFGFEYRHPNGERHTVWVSRQQVIEQMPDFIFEALCAKFCHCEPIGETNVVECRCDEYAEEFQLVIAAPAQGGDV
ncbi:hypothetical protein [Pseudomonas nitroreducens]|uniref:hypothetical protein n=1 Tax=Pseudomonas nitroreducens TaxID=46680 RepID=UPI00351DA3F2